MRNFARTIACVLILAAVTWGSPARAADLTQGVMYAVPVPNGKPPVIDGDLSDWDLSGAEPIWVSAQTAKNNHATVALMYDDNALYVGAKVSLPNRKINNPNNPTDAYWNGDVLEFRVAADPALPAPLDNSPTTNATDRIVHMTFWKNSDTNRDFVGMSFGGHLNLDKPISNPPGSQVVIHWEPSGYTLEARIPWSALNVPGGKNPFAPGQRMTAVWGIIWQNESMRTAALYRTNPGDFAFMRDNCWGQVEFSPTGNLKPHHATMEEALFVPAQAPVGVPITVNLPKAGKVSVNILGANGEVIRELTGGETHPKGPLTVYWDGRDQFGLPQAPGTFHWGAYISPGLQAVYQGTAGMSGTPPYQTADNRGGWVGDHSDLCDVATDTTGTYLLAPVAEAQRSIMKIGTDGKTVWRKTPWIGGGWGPLYAVAANGKYTYVSFGLGSAQLARLNAATGQLLTFDAIPGAPTLAPISTAPAAAKGTSEDGAEEGTPDATSPINAQPDTSGLAATATEVFASVYSQNLIQVLDAETAAPLRQLTCPSPRGVAVDAAGNLYVVSFTPAGQGKVVKFVGGHGTGTDLITGLVDPWHVAVDGSGQIYVSQEGPSQQVAVFGPDGKPLGFIGKFGGRAWDGTYRPDELLNPAGLAVDAGNKLVIVESSTPKMVSRYSLPSLKLADQWYGAGAYWNADMPDPDNPLTVYYPYEPTGYGRATIDPATGYGAPTASWNPTMTPAIPLEDPYARIAGPEVKYLNNGHKYLYSDTNHGIWLCDGDNMLPIGEAKFVGANEKTNTTKHAYIDLWSDANGNHQKDDGEVARIDTVGGAPLPNMAGSTASMWMADNGDLYLISEANAILRIPATKLDKSGTIRWNPDGASWVAKSIIPSCGENVGTGWRSGILGVRVDEEGNIYTCYNYTLPTLDDAMETQLQAKFPHVARVNWQAYATPELATAMHEGLGHSGESNAVKFVKLDKNGNILWVAGRKATAAAGPGQIYHFWDLAGLVGDGYVAGGSEWGCMSVYTSDGFYVDTLFNNPALAPPPGPYTFGGETSGGRIQYFKNRGQVWAYCTGNAYLVNGFDSHGRVIGETRVSGDVVLDKVYTEGYSATVAAQNLVLTRLTASPIAQPALWDGVPSEEVQREHTTLATVKLGYDDKNLYGLYHVVDPTPLQNSADTLNLAFKGGDAIGLDLGPGHESSTPQPGDIRILAAQINGAAHLIAMKPRSAGLSHPQDYFTPSSGIKHFEFVGEIPGSTVTLTPDTNGQGYTALFSLPLNTIDFPLASGKTVKGDLEVLLSGQGARGLQTIYRNYLFTPHTMSTTMVDDVPTESWLYPQYWGDVTVK